VVTASRPRQGLSTPHSGPPVRCTLLTDSKDHTDQLAERISTPITTSTRLEARNANVVDACISIKVTPRPLSLLHVRWRGSIVSLLLATRRSQFVGCLNLCSMPVLLYRQPVESVTVDQSVCMTGRRPPRIAFAGSESQEGKVLVLGSIVWNAAIVARAADA
jgi:hypothetical protein